MHCWSNFISHLAAVAITTVFLYTSALKERGGILFYPCVSGRVSVCLSVTNFRHSFLSNYSSQMFEILTRSRTLPFRMPYGGIHFCVNRMLTSCISVHLYVECIIWIVYEIFLTVSSATGVHFGFFYISVISMPWLGYLNEFIDFWRPDDGRNRTGFFPIGLH
jgi:hypothetical protein